MESMRGIQGFPGVKRRAQTASVRSEDSKVGLMKGNKSRTGGMWTYFNILYIMMVRFATLQRKAMIQLGPNLRRQKEGHLPCRILGTRTTWRKRQLCYCCSKNSLGMEQKFGQTRRVKEKGSPTVKNRSSLCEEVFERCRLPRDMGMVSGSVHGRIVEDCRVERQEFIWKGDSS